MSEQFVGEIRYFPYFRGAPSGWLECDGSLQDVSRFQLLADVLGTTYGGDGTSQFGLPDLRGRVPIGAGGSNAFAQQIGSETVTLATSQLPSHSHDVEASTLAGTATDPSGSVYAAAPNGVRLYIVPTSSDTVEMSGSMIGNAGEGLPHENCAPTMPILACIAWYGISLPPAG